MADVIVFLSIVPGVFEPGTIMDILPYGKYTLELLGGGDISTYLPVRWNSQYTTRQLRSMAVAGPNKFTKKIRMMQSEGGFLTTTSLAARQAQANNTLNAIRTGTTKISPQDIFILPRLDKIETLDSQLAIASTNPKVAVATGLDLV